MRKVIAAINMTLDGNCDHTAGIVDEELHYHYTELLNNAGVILYGKTTYQLMQYWQSIKRNPTGQKSMDDFAIAINNIAKIVFSHTLTNTKWETANLATNPIENVVFELKQQNGKDIIAGSRSIINQLINLNMLDEIQICIHPIIGGKGLPLFDTIKVRSIYKLVKTKTFDSGAIILYYHPK